MNSKMIPLQHVGRGATRIVKNYVKGYSDMQTKVRAATSNDPWGPSGTEMNELAQASYNQQDFIEIMETLDKRLNDKGRNWRHVFKSLTLLDYMLHAGSENVVLYFQENIYIIKTLREFVFVDEDGKDQGANVRQKAKEITNLLMDDSRMREQRRTRSNMRDRMSGRTPRNNDDEDSDDDDDRRRNRSNRRQDRSAEDDDMARAIEESKRQAAKEQARARVSAKDDADMEEAMRLSREEDERRKRALAGNNGSLFDEEQRQQQQQQQQSNNLGWDSLIDMNAPAQQPQPTGMQFASFNPYAQQQQQQQEEYMRMQQQMEMQRQMELQAQMQAQAEQEQYNQMMAQQAYLQQQQQQQQQQYLLAQQQQQAPQPLIPQQTSIGSNNPFAAFSSNKPSTPQPPVPAMPEISRPASTPAAAPALAPRPPKDDGKYAQLAAMLGNREDGIDTFGNVGALRYGQTGNRLNAQATGNNPFTRQQQQQQQQQQQPAQNNQPFFDI